VGQISSGPLKELPIEFSVRPPVAVVTLRNRTLGPTARLFIECARAVAASYDSHSTNSLNPPFATSANRRDRRPRR
jgi:hypothetical protein